MTIQWSLFVPGVLLLLIPADRLLSSRVELRSFECFRRLGHGKLFRPWWWVAALWLDPFRSFGGAYLLQRALHLDAPDWERMDKGHYIVLLALCAIGIVAQTVTRRADPGVLLAPLGYVAGVVAALTPWSVALIGCVTALVGLFAFRQFYAFFAFGLVATGVLGFVLDAPPMWIIPAMGVFAVPLAAALVTNSTMEFPVRDASGSV